MTKKHKTFCFNTFLQNLRLTNVLYKARDKVREGCVEGEKEIYFIFKIL